MAHTLKKLLVGDALTPASRHRLTRWLRANTTGDKRLRAGLPADWVVGEKTGTAGNDANDVGFARPPQGAPLIVVAYLAESATDGATRDGALASVGRLMAQR